MYFLLVKLCEEQTPVCPEIPGYPETPRYPDIPGFPEIPGYSEISGFPETSGCPEKAPKPGDTVNRYVPQVWSVCLVNSGRLNTRRLFWATIAEKTQLPSTPTGVVGKLLRDER